jgi:hypothetical protein
MPPTTGRRAASRSRSFLFRIARVIVAWTSCGLDAILSVNVRRGLVAWFDSSFELSPFCSEEFFLSTAVRTANEISCGIAIDASTARSRGARRRLIIASCSVDSLIALTFQCLVVKVLQSVRCISDRRFRRRY